jgi:shikimate dehydrogenase
MDIPEHVINGETRLHVIVGDPIAQVKSPSALTPMLLAQGHNAVVVPVHLTKEHLAAFLRAAQQIHNLDSILVTVPHKLACFEHCGATSERAQFLEAVNVMRRYSPDDNHSHSHSHGGGSGWYGEMFDGVALVRAVRAAGFEPRGQRALLFGAGGAGSAIALALVESGVQALSIHDIDDQQRDRLLTRLAIYRDVELAKGTTDPSEFDLVVNATPSGMREGDPLPFLPANLRKEMFVACVITAPALSPVVSLARDLGCATSTGGQMHAAQQQMLVDFMLGN